MPKQDQNIRELAQMFHIMGDENRLRILLMLQDKELNVTQLCRKLNMPQPTVSRHLGILRMGGLVINRRSGKEIFYSIRTPLRDESGRLLKAILKSDAAVRIGRLAVGLVGD